MVSLTEKGRGRMKKSTGQASGALAVLGSRQAGLDRLDQRLFLLRYWSAITAATMIAPLTISW